MRLNFIYKVFGRERSFFGCLRWLLWEVEGIFGEVVCFIVFLELEVNFGFSFIAIVVRNRYCCCEVSYTCVEVYMCLLLCCNVLLIFWEGICFYVLYIIMNYEEEMDRKVKEVLRVWDFGKGILKLLL